MKVAMGDRTKFLVSVYSGPSLIGRATVQAESALTAIPIALQVIDAPENQLQHVDRLEVCGVGDMFYRELDNP